MNFLWKALFGLLGPLALIAGAYFYWQHHIQKQAVAPYVAAQKVTAQEARTDTGTMQASGARVGTSTAAQTAQASEAARAAGKEIHDEFTKPLGPVATAPSFDLGVLAAPINGLVLGADGAADAADAARRAGEAGAP